MAFSAISTVAYVLFWNAGAFSSLNMECGCGVPQSGQLCIGQCLVQFVSISPETEWFIIGIWVIAEVQFNLGVLRHQIFVNEFLEHDRASTAHIDTAGNGVLQDDTDQMVGNGFDGQKISYLFTS